MGAPAHSPAKSLSFSVSVSSLCRLFARARVRSSRYTLHKPSCRPLRIQTVELASQTAD